MALLELPFQFQTKSQSQMTSLEDEVVHQTKILCRDFIFLKLKENALVDRDIYDTIDCEKFICDNSGDGTSDSEGFDKLLFPNQDVRHNTKSQDKPGPTDVSKELITIAAVFERNYPNLFEDVGNYLKVSYHTPAQIESVYNSVASEIFRSSITWARIVALFIFTAALTVDCVKQGQEKFANVIVESMQKFIRKQLANWIACRGGWSGLLDHFQESQHPKWQLWVAPSIGTIIGILLALIG